jgi:hypothetical protein
MNFDIRLSLGFFEHPKTKKLQRRCGLEGIVCLQKLWLWAADQRSSGILSGLDEEEIELAAGWSGEVGKFFAALIECRWLDKQTDVYSLHGWEEHQAYAIKSEERSMAAKKAAEARWAQERENAERMRNDAETMRSACGAHANAMQTHADSNAPRTLIPVNIKDIKENTSYSCQNLDFDAPSVEEKPAIEQGTLVDQHVSSEYPQCPQQKILSLYREILPSLPDIRTLRPNLQSQVRARWNEKCHEKGFSSQEEGLEYFRKFFTYVSNNDFLTGRKNTGQRKWRCSYAWLMKAENFDKVTSGYYSEGDVA